MLMVEGKGNGQPGRIGFRILFTSRARWLWSSYQACPSKSEEPDRLGEALDLFKPKSQRSPRPSPEVFCARYPAELASERLSSFFYVSAQITWQADGNEALTTPRMETNMFLETPLRPTRVDNC